MLLCLLALLLPGMASADSDRWVLQDGSEYFGEAKAYNFKTKQLDLVKADGKEFALDATQLSFPGKMQLFSTPAFGEALQGYHPPLIPTVMAVIMGLITLVIPTLIGVWGGAHVIGAIDTPRQHLIAVGKVVIILVSQILIYLLASSILDTDMPVVPDKSGDVMLFLCLVIMGLLVGALVLSAHYHQSFFRGIGITFLSGVFAFIVFLAMMLGSFFLFLRSDAETLVTRFVFEPFGWF